MSSDKLQSDPRPGVSRSRPPLLRALSLDPGGTTGYAICDINSNNSISINWDQAKLTESELTELMETVIADVVICEDFEYRNRARAGLDLTSPRLIGVVKLFSQSSDTKLVLQKAMVGKGHYSDQRLKTLDLYRRGTPHGRDALRHLLHWLTFKEGNKYIDLLTVHIDILDIDVLLDRSFSRDNT